MSAKGSTAIDFAYAAAATVGDGVADIGVATGALPLPWKYQKNPPPIRSSSTITVYVTSGRPSLEAAGHRRRTLAGPINSWHSTGSPMFLSRRGPRETKPTFSLFLTC